MSLSAAMLKKAEAMYSCAADLDVQIHKFTEARDLLNKFGDQYSEAASALAEKERSSPPPAPAEHKD